MRDITAACIAWMMFVIGLPVALDGLRMGPAWLQYSALGGIFLCAIFFTVLARRPTNSWRKIERYQLRELELRLERLDRVWNVLKAADGRLTPSAKAQWSGYVMRYGTSLVREDEMLTEETRMLARKMNRFESRIRVHFNEYAALDGYVRHERDVVQRQACPACAGTGNNIIPSPGGARRGEPCAVCAASGMLKVTVEKPVKTCSLCGHTDCDCFEAGWVKKGAPPRMPKYPPKRPVTYPKFQVDQVIDHPPYVLQHDERTGSRKFIEKGVEYRRFDDDRAQFEMIRNLQRLGVSDGDLPATVYIGAQLQNWRPVDKFELACECPNHHYGIHLLASFEADPTKVERTCTEEGCGARWIQHK